LERYTAVKLARNADSSAEGSAQLALSQIADFAGKMTVRRFTGSAYIHPKRIEIVGSATVRREEALMARAVHGIFQSEAIAIRLRCRSDFVGCLVGVE
jgi:hypothetical protein